MSPGTVSHYSSRNLDACTLQLNRWRPFVASPTSDIAEFYQSARYGDLETLTGAGASPTRPLDSKTNGAVSSRSPALPAARRAFKQIMSRSVGVEWFRWAYHPRKEEEGASSLDQQDMNDRRSWDFEGQQSSHADWTWRMGSLAQNYGLGLPSSVYVELMEDSHRSGNPDECLQKQGLDDDVKLKDMDMMEGLSPASGICGAAGHLTEQAAAAWHNELKRHSSDLHALPSLMDWSRREEQVSCAFARGLWRWKRRNSHAHKGRRKCGSVLSGSGRSSESWKVRIDASDAAPTVGASAARATCSDIPMACTDSSGELFYGGGIGWDSEISSSGEGAVHRINGVDVLHARIVSETQSLESGYGSESGYRGDGELGYEEDGVPDAKDEDEREQLRLGPWKEGIAEKSSSAGGITLKIIKGEGYMCASKVQHRLRRRRQDSRIPLGTKR